MDTQYLQEIGPSNSGIWVRMKQKNNDAPKEELVIRKSKSFYKQVFGSEEQNSSKSVPRKILEKYRIFTGQREARHKMLLKGNENLQESQTFDKIPSVRDKDYNSFVDERIPDDSIADIEIKGTSKLLSEIRYAKSIHGSKYLIKNHHLNDHGEGEPSRDEEVIIQND